MSVTMYYENDADLGLLADKTVCVIGYGSQGHAHSRNLHDSGVKVTVALRQGSKNWKRVEEHGLEPVEMAQAVAKADLVCMLLPDMAQAKVYKEFVEPHLSAGKCLVVAHGLNLHYGMIKPPADVDVIMVAPKGPGALVREVYEEGGGVPTLIAVHQDATGKARQIGLAYAKGIGGTRAGVVETTIKEETETDLFGEQAVLCGGCCALIKAGFETLVEAGYSEEMAYFECLHELKLIVDLIYRGGLAEMRYFISETAKYGDITRGPRVVDEYVKEEMRAILEEIQNGEFAREWILENQAGMPVYNALLNREAEHPIEEVGRKLRGMMKWLA